MTKNTRLKYQKIIDEWFVNEFKGASAYRKFHPKIKSNKTATVNFSRLQATPEMQEYIHSKHREAARFIDMTNKGVLQELKRWVESDITATIALSPEEIKELPIEIRRLITKYIVRENEYYDKNGALLSKKKSIELHFVSKERAQEMINKHIGFYEVDNKQKAPQINYDGLKESTLLELWNARKIDD